jgi:2-polyprenyl-6-methoxyphenol hydroxylase-like FAD-dependent oxidoreductase
MAERFDVAIVGARCAGSPLATMLARQGLSVCLLDRARFPSETPSTHMIQPCGVQMLDRLGLLDGILAAGAAPLDRLTLVNDDVRIDATVDEAAQHPALCIRRVTLDALLVEAAGAAGAEVRTGSRVAQLITDDGRVTGVETSSGPVHARLVVGADGRHSTIASCVGAREYHVTPPGKLYAWAYFEGVGNREGHARLGRQGAVGFLAGPTDGDLYMAAIGIDMADQAEFHADRDTNFAAAIRMWPELADLLAEGRRVGPIRVIANWHGYFRQSAGPGWVLVGDAGHFKDPAPGQGIADAFRQTEKLATAIVDALGNSNLDTAAQRWWRWRDHDAYEMYWYARNVGAPGVTSPLITRALRDIAADPDATRTFLRILNHDVRPSQLFTPARLARAATRIFRHEPGQIVATVKEIISLAKQNARQGRRRRLRPPGMADVAWEA